MEEIKITIDEIIKEQFYTSTIAKRDTLIINLYQELEKTKKELSELKKSNN
ncbi:MAG: hypothetical protein WC346_09520 [Methanogenium sp.]|jgi:hypothetical protein